MDATAAFYKVRLSREDGCTAIVRCLGKKYRVDRMAFGIRCGPGVLEEILTALVAEVEAKVRLSFPDDPLHIWVYVDDFTLLGSRQVVEAAQKLLIERGSSWGFTFSAHKTHRVDFHPDGWVSAFKEFRHLGVTFACKCVPKRADMFELCLRCTTPSLSQELFQEGQRTTKRALFKLAGLSHDPLAIHAEQALAGDLIRRVAGKWKDLGWDEQARLTAKEADALSKAISVIRAWQREGPCEHPTAFGATELRVTTDASPYGYGYHVDVLGGKFGPVKLHRRAKFWKGPSVSWHMNRREAFCLSAAHLFVESIVMFIRPLSLRIMSDSRTALSWVQGGSRLTCRSVERVALARLCDAVCELREAWRRRYGVYSQLSHVAADENEEADALSRLGVRWRIPKEILLDGREAVVDDCECDDHGKLSDQVEGRLAIILDADAGSPPAEVSVAPGKPARRKLLQLQWQSPSARLILQCLGSNPPDEAGSALLCVHGPAPRALARELADFFVADDGVLLKRVTTARLNGIQAHRLCYFIPADTSDGKGFAEHVVSQYHDEAGCLNVRYLRWLITRTFYYPNIRRLVNDLSKSRNKCQQSFSRRYYSTTDGGRSLNEGVRSVWQTISIDLAEMGPDRYSRYHSAIFLIDHFSRYVWISPIRNSTSSAVVGALSTCFDWWGNPSLLQSDGGPAFRSAAFRKFLLERGIVQRITNPGSPFANGLVERSISALKTLCRGVANKRVWPTLLSKAFVRLNCKPLSDVGLTPHEIFFCRPRRLSVENALENDGPESSAIATLDDVANLMNVRKVMNDMVKTALHKSITDSREICGTRGRGPPAIGDEVLLFEPNSFGRGGSYGSTVYRVYGQVGRTTLQLVLAGPYQGPVNKSDILECHYFNTRPYNRPSGGHVE
ncbi:gag/pol/env polyprotein, putative [Perkinsus marinus ATCC 50983]|uniref:Gag/pol/env polyprotein, putative n=1 Tax=Perkinsus marinus (strain ATCC 50983 / TXsc) TaxID=423536 RepID=C5LI04_PERM5|nr:gag/pol/env polyprotein, putative [Perkinsus marinus ATCC 50983]EER03758.1 gag/pol/env polyprotein, putative [Perkinsus marinus ATCC 50983]|eukprot:XP_002771942.1 gag/pol/env polyprotein, putative [Perkinsus marinus ATCC 50983]